MKGEINAIVKECGDIRKSKGWDFGNEPIGIHALIHCEIAEATEEVRRKTPYLYQMGINYVREKYIIDENHPDWRSAETSYTPKPEGQAVELMDAVILIMSYYEAMGWDFEKILRLKMHYNRIRSGGGKNER